MNKIKTLMAAILITISSYAQHKTNTVTHTIKQGETIGALAKQYGVQIGDILQANNLTDKTVLKIGQKVVVPMSHLKSINTTAVKSTEKPKLEKNQHLIVKGESLNKISAQYNVSKQDLMDWNNLPNDNIRVGDYLYIIKPKNFIAKKIAKEDKTPIVKKETPKKNESIVEKPKLDPKEIAIKKEEIKKVEPVVVIQKQETKEVVTKPKPVTSEKLDEGYFEKQFEPTNNSVEGTCGVFKTIAGWHDKKYYVLVNNAENGSIVKVMANNKFVYAKVLGPLPNIKEASNYTMRISNAAAAALGIAENKFNAKIEF